MEVKLMKRHSDLCRAFLTAGALVLFLLQTGCSTVAVTGRSQLDLIPASTMLSMSDQQYSEFLSSNRLSTNRDQTALVKKVGTRIQGAVENYFRSQNMSKQLQGYSWQFNLVDSKEANAWCMPGGRVVVYTGILPITQTEAGLAVVLAHEIAHAVAEHGNERMSQELLAQLGGMALSEAVAKKPKETQQIYMTAFGLGAEYGALLPFSRLQENEADHLGLIFMAMAGYDPHEALFLWQRMSQSNSGQALPEFMSTHPSDATRIAKIEQEMPEAMQYYRSAK
jgi:predicted Zn-dependent protease